MAWIKTAIAVAALTFLAGCGKATVVDEPSTPERRQSAQTTLIGRVTQALDATYTAEYEWSKGGTVTVWAAEDGTWRVDVPAWALGGTVDVSVAWTTGGFFQCAEDECVKLAGITGQIPKKFDPRVQLPFTDWLPVLLDRHSPFMVARQGDCFSLTANTVVVGTPIPAGEWCLDGAGTILSVANGEFGTLTLAAEPRPAEATVELPGEIVDGEALDAEAPPEPTPEPTPDPSAQPSEPGPSQTPSAEASEDETAGEEATEEDQ